MIIDKIIIDYDGYNSIYIIIIVNAKEVHINDAIFNYNRSIVMYHSTYRLIFENIYIEQI
jgi:hypothetical protein